jgi:linoleoyl-CoA desaturase
MHRFQQFYAPLVYAMVYLHTVYVQDFVYLFKRNLANMRDIRHPPAEYAVFAATKSAHIVITLVVPMLLSPFAWWQALVAYVTMAFVSSALFVYLLIGTHFCEEVVFPPTATDGQLPTDWATHALATSADWSPQSRIAAVVAGGVNTHAAHHLFPNFCHSHYRWITPIIAELAAEHGVQYNALTLPAMIASHFRLLRRLGRDG